MRYRARQTSSSKRKIRRVQRRDHRLASLQTIALQVGEFELKELVQRFALCDELVNALLLTGIRKGRACAIRECARTKDAQSFEGGVHVFVTRCAQRRPTGGWFVMSRRVQCSGSLGASPTGFVHMIPLTSYFLESSVSPYRFGSSASTSSRWRRSNGSMARCRDAHECVNESTYRRSEAFMTRFCSCGMEVLEKGIGSGQAKFI